MNKRDFFSKLTQFASILALAPQICFKQRLIDKGLSRRYILVGTATGRASGGSNLQSIPRNNQVSSIIISWKELKQNGITVFTDNTIM